MKLTDLDPNLIRWEDRVEPRMKVATGFDTASEAGMHAWDAAGQPTEEVIGPVTYVPQVATLADAQGIEFDCPRCTGQRSHRIQVAFRGRGVLDHQGSRSHDGKPSRWQVAAGSGLDDLTLTPSIDCTHSDPKCWHGFITRGEIIG